MARKQQPRVAAPKRKRSITRIVFYVLSIIIVLSMTIGFVIDVVSTPATYRTVTPTPVLLPTAGPSLP
jgi:cell division septal protein FtsQ